MHIFFHIGKFAIPGYGFMIATGVILSNIVAIFIIKKTKQDFNDFIILESYCFLGAFIGAKLLYLFVSYKEIDWTSISDLKYLNQLILAGFVFYGGLIGGLLLVLLAGKLHKIETTAYIRNFIFLIPFIHCFGRIGCFCAGCCYGIPYSGPGAIIFPEESFALPGVSLFPVQLVEAAGLMMIALLILLLQVKFKWNYTVETYFVLYAFLRFGLENMRYDESRGFFYGLSTSQWISLFLIIAAIALFVQNKLRRR